MTLQNRGTYRNKIMLYIPPDKKEVVYKAKKIMEREGESLSKKFVEFCEDYERLHRHGNPQLLMSKFTESLDQKKCWRCGQTFPVLQKVRYISDRIEGVCSRCVELDRERGVVRKVLGAI